ncbi:MAG TPA: hypothetical protein VN861_03490 [Candidatus Acidoferrales bacterium]|nr:hypothetical protein [Candidatus Acidoferrales bacterium]
MKQRIDFERGGPGLKLGYYVRDWDLPHPIGPFGSIADAHNWLVKAGQEQEQEQEQMASDVHND